MTIRCHPERSEESYTINNDILQPIVFSGKSGPVSVRIPAYLTGFFCLVIMNETAGRKPAADPDE
jgi:hypothetical protein